MLSYRVHGGGLCGVTHGQYLADNEANEVETSLREKTKQLIDVKVLTHIASITSTFDQDLHLRLYTKSRRASDINRVDDNGNGTTTRPPRP